MKTGIILVRPEDCMPPRNRFGQFGNIKKWQRIMNAKENK